MDVTVTWNNTTIGTPTSYLVTWIQNGTPLAPNSVPATSAQDMSGYSLDFNTSQPTIGLNPGDVIGATVQAIDGVNNLSGPVTASTPSSVTIPSAPVAPGSPNNVVLALS